MGNKKKERAANRKKATPPVDSLRSDAIATDAVGLALMQRKAGSKWVFTSRDPLAPPLAGMSTLLQALSFAARLAPLDSYWWWITDQALDDIARQLHDSNHCVVDGMLGESRCAALQREVCALRQAGRLKASRLAGGRSGAMTSYTHSAVRGDLVSWFNGEEAEQGALPSYLLRVDTLIDQLKPRLQQLQGITGRSNAMVACYPGGGARYVRHCDNSCDAGSGNRCNGRRLTAILYLNCDWQPGDGGELRLFEPFAPPGRPPLADVQPLADRVVLFFADYRVPHEARLTADPTGPAARGEPGSLCDALLGSANRRYCRRTPTGWR